MSASLSLSISISMSISISVPFSLPTRLSIHASSLKRPIQRHFPNSELDNTKNEASLRDFLNV